VAAELAAAGRRFHRRSKGEGIGAADIHLADTIGEMGLWYRLADIAFLGGSLAPRGGQNPIEPAKLGVPVLHGPHVGNFREVYEALAAAGGVIETADASALATAVACLLDAPEDRARLARAAQICVESFTGTLDRTLQALEPYLDALQRKHQAAARA
jgi:3-deoxy-D-manno-octulosonic-acid transferase